MKTKFNRNRPSNRLEPRSANPTDEAPYFWITKRAGEILIKAGADAATVAVYAALCWLQNNSGQERFYASAAQIAAHARCGARTVVRKLADLARLKLIAIESGRRAKAMHEANRYVLASTRYATKAHQLRHGGASVTPTNPASMAHSKERGHKAPVLQRRTDTAAVASGVVAPAARGGELDPLKGLTQADPRWPRMKNGWPMGPRCAVLHLRKLAKQGIRVDPPASRATPQPAPPPPTPEELEANRQAQRERDARFADEDRMLRSMGHRV